MAAETKAKNENKSFIANITSYLRAVWAELKKVSWPTREDVINLTRIVLLVTAVTSLGLGMLSIGLTWFMDQIGLEYPPVMIVVFLVIAGGAIFMFRRDETKSY